MLIRSLEISDIGQIASLHKKIFKRTHFSSLFNLALLEKYFTELLNHFEYTFAVCDKTQVVGYLIAGKNPGIVINKFLKHNSFDVLLVLLFNPVFIFEKIRTVFSKILNPKPDVHEEGISIYLIAVDSETQQRGLGKQLLNYFEARLNEHKITSYTLAVRPDNENAINFYLRNNFIEIARDYKSISFIKQLKI